MKIKIIKNVLARGQRFVSGETVEVSDAIGADIIGAGLGEKVGGEDEAAAPVADEAKPTKKAKKGGKQK